MERCNCNEWMELMKKLAFFVVKDGIYYHDIMDVRKFEYCPWCGSELED